VASYAIVQHFPFCVRVMVIGAACSRSSVVVPAGPVRMEYTQQKIMAEGN
jgi:hypothetical protein